MEIQIVPYDDYAAGVEESLVVLVKVGKVVVLEATGPSEKHQGLLVGCRMRCK